MINIFVVILLLIIVLLVLKFFIYKVETLLLFHPVKVTEGYIASKLPKKENELKKLFGSEVELKRFNIITPDFETLDLIYFKNPNVTNLLLYSHGNAGNIYNFIPFIKKFGKYVSILCYDYRGYGASSGTPSEKGLYIDIETVWKFVINDLKYDTKNIVLYGESLGCSVVTWLGQHLIKNKQRLPKGIIIQSGFYNLKQMVSDFFSKYLTIVLSSRFENINYIHKINGKIPLLIVHSLNDELINIEHPKRIVNECKIPKDNFLIVKGPHNSPVYTPEEFSKVLFFIT